MKKQLLALTMLTIGSFSAQKLQAYCIYNDTGNTLRASVFISKNVGELSKKFYDATRWAQDNIAKLVAGEAGPGGTVALETGKKYGFLQDTFIKLGSITDNQIPPFNMQTKTSGKACYNYADIAKRFGIKDPKVAREKLTLYIMLMDPATSAVIPMSPTEMFFPVQAGGWLSLRVDSQGSLVYQLGGIQNGKEYVIRNTGAYLGSYPGDTGQLRKIKTIQVK